ncbi:MAG: DoxX family membrane protein [Deltaproteobacteria bacterium]|nr:MAG: DoxX family membrane protein [Deltaproteobacteria bacterium]TMA71869.1 MAG: DoxX family membrane protein [Deltaproteobacteria bacterium]TMB34355.1 MAG: DoxX family membrane protein [Deltaproteobacteria bacterium]
MMARVLTGVRIVLGALFIWAAVTKLPDMAGFAQDVANYRIVPAALVPFVASAVVGIELLGGIALVAGVMERAAAAVIACLLVAFIAFLSQALLRGIDLRCGCFGGDEPASWWTVARDLLMLAAAVVVARGPVPQRQVGKDLTDPA